MFKKAALSLCMLVCVIAGVFSMQFSGYAMPADPESDWSEEDGACGSYTNEDPVTLDVLERRDRLAQQAGDVGSTAQETTLVKYDAKSGKQMKLPLLVIVAAFSQPTGNYTSGIYYRGDFNWAEKAFKGDWSMAAYYSDMSLNKFTFTPVKETSAFGVGDNFNVSDTKNDGIVHVTLDMAHGSWAKHTTKASVESEYQMVSAALKAASKYVDFKSYDANKNGSIENNELALCIIAAGFEASSASSSLPYGETAYMWGHSWTLKDMKTRYKLSYAIPKPDGVAVSSFVSMGEIGSVAQKGDEVIPYPTPIGVLSHEMGHYLGLPDLYDTDVQKTNEWKEYEVDRMSLMSTGGWGRDLNGEYRAFSMDVWCRYKLGWITPTKVTRGGTFTVTAQDYSAKTPSIKVAKIVTSRSNEYYLVENQLFTGWDEGKKVYCTLKKDDGTKYSSNGGVVIWHIDDGIYKKYKDSNSVNDSDHRPAVMPLYPERESSKKYTMIREKSGGSVSTYPFLESKVLAGPYKNLKAGFYLPFYGTGDTADMKAGRQDSCFYFKYGSASGKSASFKLSMEHTPELETVVENKKNATVKKAGSYERVRYCEVCGKELSRKKYVIPKLPTGWKVKAGKKYYYDTKTGKLTKGWKQIKKKWYYFNNKGVMQKGWVKSGGAWYYMDKKGIMQTGWKKVGGSWYYFNKDGSMAVGWVQSGGKWYYMNTSGVMFTGTLSCGGRVYRFGSDGVCLNR